MCLNYRSVSPNGWNACILQADGNFVCYTGCSTPYWSTGTSTSYTPTLTLQSDGNLVLYANSAAIWNTGTLDSRVKELRLQDDRRLVLSKLTGADSTSSDLTVSAFSMTATTVNTAIPTPVPTPVPTVAWAPSPPTLKPSSACVYYTGWTWRPPLGSEVSEFY